MNLLALVRSLFVLRPHQVIADLDVELSEILLILDACDGALQDVVPLDIQTLIGHIHVEGGLLPVGAVAACSCSKHNSLLWLLGVLEDTVEPGNQTV
jgi:hypothetical protein